MPSPLAVRALRWSCLAPLTALSLGAQAPAARAPLAEPGLSPDGARLAFVSGGDIWTVPSAGGVATLLVSHPANESRPLFSPDGTRLAFVSDRSGNGDVYVLELATNRLTRVTHDDASEQLGGWSPDGAWLYLNSSSQDIAGMHDVLRVRATGGTPMVVAGDRYASEYWAAPSPDGRTLAITARGTVTGQWWRNGHSHIDESELWLLRPGADGAAPSYEATRGTGGTKEAWPMWAPDGRSLYFVSHRSGAENLWQRTLAGGADRQLTTFPSGRVLWPSISRDGRLIAFERDFGLWVYDTGSGAARPLTVTLQGSAATPAPQRTSVTSGFAFAVAPDQRKLAVVARGDLFGVSAREGGEAEVVTATVGVEADPLWLPDSRRLLFSAWRDGRWGLWRYDFSTREETALPAPGEAWAPLLDPAGQRVAYVRDGRELRVMRVDGSDDRLLATGSFGRPPFAGDRRVAWSPDGQWVAFLRPGERGWTNAWVVPAAGGEPRQVSFLANSNAGGLEWSGDGRFLLYETSQRTEETQVVRVDLVPRAPQFREDAFRALFPAGGAGRDSAAAPRDTARRGAAVPAVRIVFDDIRTRASRVTVGLTVNAKFLSPDGKSLAFTSGGGGSSNLYVVSLDEGRAGGGAARQLTTTSGAKGNVRWSPDGRELWFTDAGRISAVGVESRAVRSVNVTATLGEDFDRTKRAVFEQAWSTQRDWFYDAAMHGVDWPAVRARTAPLVEGSRTPEELRRVLGLMVGELNASHLGISGPSSAGQVEPVGRLGVDFDRAAYEARGEFVIAALLPDGPLARLGTVRVGDRLEAVDSVALAGGTDLYAVLRHTVGRKLTLTLRTGREAPRTVSVQPISAGAEKALRYAEWVEQRRAYVARASGGRLGYVHIQDMSEGALTKLYADLDTENYARDGVVVDVRNNNGGFVNAYALDVFARKPYLELTRRGAPSAPGRMQLGQRSLEKPTVLVTNQHSLSDAEDFAEGYRALGLGRIVGEPTSGWIIYTSNITLLDGATVMRLPFTRVRTAAGEEMERKPRPVDVPVRRPVGEAYGARDSQLDAAVRVLLEQLGR
jgi:tricorn protease